MLKSRDTQTYLIQLILALLRIIYCWLIAIVPEMSGCNQTISAFVFHISIFYSLMTLLGRAYHHCYQGRTQPGCVDLCSEDEGGRLAQVRRLGSLVGPPAQDSRCTYQLVILTSPPVPSADRSKRRRQSSGLDQEQRRSWRLGSSFCKPWS